MNNPPIFSVIIPNYNHEPYLRERINSVIYQQFDSFEVILLDDHSSDNSKEILHCYQNDPHISHVIINEENSGSTFLQWQKGFDLACGKYIWIAESDDFADKMFLAKAYEILQKEKNVSLLYYKSQIIDENSTLQHKHEPQENNDYRVWDGNEFIKRKMLRGNVIINASSVIFRRCSIPQNKLYTKFRFCGDWFFWCLIASQGKVVRVNEYYNYFRMHSVKVTPKALAEGLKYIELDCFVDELLDLSGLPVYRRILIKSLIYSDMLRDIYVSPDARSNVIKNMPNTNLYEKLLGQMIKIIKTFL